MSSSPASAAEVLVARLAQYGVRHLFGYPGGQLTPLYDALYRHAGIRHLLTRHEQAAAFMADGYARATGGPGVCLAVCGPGLYNAATPLAAALSDSVPVLLISGQVPARGAGLGSGYYHENDQLAAARAFTRAQFRAETAAEVVPLLDQAWQALTRGRPGPVLFEVPVDVLRGELADARLPDLPALPPPPAPASAELDSAARLLAGWRRPLILAGGGVVRAGGEAALARLATRLGAPVFHTANGKCALPARHPLAAGMPWRRVTSDLSGMEDLFSPLFRQADGLLAVGCRFSQLATGSWTLPLPAALIHLDLDAAEIGRHYPPTLGLRADARLALTALADLLPETPRPPWTTLPPRDGSWRLPGIDVLPALRRALPDDAIVSADVTRLAYMLMADFPLDLPRSFLHPAGAVAMGYGLPAALGAKAAFPQRTVLAVVGDGGFQMAALELATAVQEHLPVIILLINDNCLSLIKATQQRRYDNRFIGVHLRNPDFARFAAAYDVAYRRAEDDRALHTALSEAVQAGETCLIEVRPGDAV